MSEGLLFVTTVYGRNVPSQYQGPEYVAKVASTKKSFQRGTDDRIPTSHDIYKRPEIATMTTPAASTKDNSAIVEDSGINASDGSTALRDSAVLAGGNVTTGNQFGVGGNFDAGNDNQINIVSADADLTAAAIAEAGETSRAATADAFGFGTSTVQESFDAMRENSSKAFDLVEETTYEAFQANAGVTSDAFDLVEENSYQAFQFSENALDEVGESNRTLAGVLDDALGFAEVAQRTGNELAQASNVALANKSSDADSAVSATLQKNILIGMALIGLVVAFK